MRKIDKEQIIRGIERANPWWKGESVGFSDLPKRVHFTRLLQLVEKRDPVRALVLMGPRRVGKTVIVYHLISQLIANGRNPKTVMYLSLDNPIFRLSSLEDLFSWGLEWAGSPKDGATVFFDEIQYLENWEQQLKVLVDTHRTTKFIATGSAAAALHRKSKESGAGRFSSYLLPALSFYEYVVIKGQMTQMPSLGVDLLKLNDLYLEYLNFGGFPEAITSESVRQQPELYIGQDILDKVLGRDLPGIYGVTNPNELQRLFSALAYNSSSEISPEGISKNAGVSKADITKYLGFFEAAYLLRIIDKTDDSLKKFQRRTHFKVILTNPSLRSAIFGKMSADSRDLEGMAETAIFSQLLVPEGVVFPYRYAKWNRGGSKGEVDLVRLDPQGLPVAAVEIKWTDRFALGEEKPKSLISFCRSNKLSRALMTTKSAFAETEIEGLRIRHLPTSILCFVLGMMKGVYDGLAHRQTLGELAALQKDDDQALRQFAGEIATEAHGIRYLKGELWSSCTVAVEEAALLIGALR